MKHLLAFLRGLPAHGDSTDHQLLDRFTTGRDERAFDELVRRHGPLVWGVCRRNLSNLPDAEDAFQATFLVLVRRAAGLPAHTTLGPWLYRVAVWCCRGVRRANRRRLRRVRPAVTEPVLSPAPPLDPDLDAALETALLALPEKYRVPVILCHLQGWTRRQAAEYLGCPEGTLSALLSRALVRLRAALADRDPAALLAIAGALAVPPALATAAVRSAVIYTTAAGTLPPTVLATAKGVLRMFRVQTWRLAAIGLAAVAGVACLVAGLAAQSGAPAPRAAEQPAARPAAPPALAAGQWALTEWLAPHFPERRLLLTIAEKDHKPAITGVQDESFRWQPKGLTVVGRRVTFTLAREGPLDTQFDGLFDPADPTRVLGSLWEGGPSADRAVLELVPPGGTRKPPKPESPPEWAKYLGLAVEQGQAEAEADGPAFAAKPPAEQAALRAAAAAARQRYFAEVPRLFRKLVAERAEDPFGYEAAMELLAMTDRLKPDPAEIEAWVKVARAFAATHGPQFEAITVGRAATVLSRHAAHAAPARAYAAEADRLARATGMPATYADTVAQYDEERAAWAGQPQAPPDGATWTVRLTGRVTDARGNPVADAEVLVNNMQWANVLISDGSNKTRTGPDGRYTITLKCQGTYRLHVTHMWAEKRGFVRADDLERHRLLPGQSATIDFTLRSGELFGGTLHVRREEAERAFGPGFKATHVLTITGPGVSETVLVDNGGKFELSLPAGTYAVAMQRGRKKLTWPGLKTGRTDHVLDEPPFRFTEETVGAGFDELWKAMDRNYSYFTLKPDVDWSKLRDEYRPKAVKAKSASELAAVLAEMLSHLKDGHVWIELPDGKVVGMHGTSWAYNGNRKVVLAQLGDVTECGAYAVVGKTKPDGFGYFLMQRQSAATPELVAKAVAAIEKLADAPGFVIDLRNANGGSEPLAQEVARLFCANKVVYARSRFRNGPGHEEFTEDCPRELPPAKSGKPYLKPVVCLLGPGCVSSGEGFAQMLAALPHVTTVGLPTRGSSGNPGPADVGDTGVVVYFSRWVDQMPDGTVLEGKGVQPRVVVTTTAEAYRDADPTLAKGLELLRAKAGGGK
jgi:RNA polymerase sigma factor (sigma-70 family)